MVVGVSAAGDVAVLTHVRHIPSVSLMDVGTLARAPLSGGVAREILGDVWDADISRDGQQFAVVRSVNEVQQLEYPIGKVLFKSVGYLSHSRIAPAHRERLRVRNSPLPVGALYLHDQITWGHTAARGV
jgi:hypothetical protein